MRQGRRVGLLAGWVALLASLLACQMLIPTAQPAAAVQVLVISPAPEHFTMVQLRGAGSGLTRALAEQAQLASQAGRRPFVDFYADWCMPCRDLDANLSDPAMLEAFDGTYIIRLDLDEWKPYLVPAGFLVPGIPAFYAINARGKPTGRSITGAAWGENTAANMAPPLKAFFQAVP